MLIGQVFGSIIRALATAGRTTVQAVRTATTTAWAGIRTGATAAWAGVRKGSAAAAAWARTTALPAARHFATVTVPAAARRSGDVLRDWGRRASHAAKDAAAEGAQRAGDRWAHRHVRRALAGTGRTRDDLNEIACPYCGGQGRDLDWYDKDWRGRPRTEVVVCRECDRRFYWVDGAPRRRSLLARLLAG